MIDEERLIKGMYRAEVFGVEESFRLKRDVWCIIGVKELVE